MLLKYILFFPGYIILMLGYFAPKEWGKSRSVAKSSRQWNHRDQIAPFYSILIYGVLIWYFIDSRNKGNLTANTPKQENPSGEFLNTASVASNNPHAHETINRNSFSETNTGYATKPNYPSLETSTVLKAEPVDSGDASVEILHLATINEWSADRIRTEINTIYARHGVEFGDKNVQAWANQQIWYQKIPGMSYSDAENKFTLTERTNIELLADARRSKKSQEDNSTQAKKLQKLTFIDGESNLRTEPGIKSTIKFKPRKGTTGTILERSGKWIKLELENGDSGWAHESNLESVN